jgi:predicted RNA-binding protein with PIN domain
MHSPSDCCLICDASGGLVRWIVDGMNVIGTRPDGWWKDRHRAMVALVDRLDRWASAAGDDVTVVFERPPASAIASSVVQVAHAPRADANSADDEIVRLVAADRRPNEIRVVTSDRALAQRVRAMGASTCPAETFRDMIDPRSSGPAAWEHHAE